MRAPQACDQRAVLWLRWLRAQSLNAATPRPKREARRPHSERDCSLGAAAILERSVTETHVDAAILRVRLLFVPSRVHLAT